MQITYTRDSKEGKITTTGSTLKGSMRKTIFIHSGVHEANILWHFPICQILFKEPVRNTSVISTDETYALEEENNKQTKTDTHM